MSITPLPPAPAITDTTSEFNTKAFNFVAALDTFVTETNEVAEVCSDAEVTASAALALVGAVAWVSGTTYAIGNPVYSPIDLQTYRRKTVGAGTTDPSLDAANWARVVLSEPTNQITATATGTLSDGSTVALNIDGTVSIVSAIAFSAGTPVAFATDVSGLGQRTACYDSFNNKVVAFISGTAVVGTVSGTTISFGTPVTIVSPASDVITLACCFDSFNNKVVFAYRDNNNSQRGTVRVGTVSGTSISFGSAVVFSSNDTHPQDCIFNSANNTVVIVYNDGSNSNFGNAIVGTVSGTSISFGTAVVFESANAVGPKGAYDSVNNRIVLAYRDFGNSSFGTAVVGTVSGTSISFGTHVIFRSALVNFCSVGYDSLNNKILIAYQDAPNSHGTAIVGTVSGTSISFGTSVVFAAVNTAQISAVYENNFNSFIIVYQDVSSSNFGKAVQATISGTSVSFSSPITFESAEATSIKAIYDSLNKKIVVDYRDVGNSSAPTQSVISLPSSNSLSFIGFSSGAYTNGQTATVKTVGSIIENQTGLSASNKYYVANNGTLTTTANSAFAGTALSSTKLIVKG